MNEVGKTVLRWQVVWVSFRWRSKKFVVRRQADTTTTWLIYSVVSALLSRQFTVKNASQWKSITLINSSRSADPELPKMSRKQPALPWSGNTFGYVISVIANNLSVNKKKNPLCKNQNRKYCDVIRFIVLCSNFEISIHVETVAICSLYDTALLLYSVIDIWWTGITYTFRMNWVHVK